MKAYSEYKDSGVQWIGEVPMHWEIVPFKFYTNVIMGQSPNGDDIKSEGEMPFMQGNAEFGNTYPSSIYFCETCTKFSRIGDILMSVRAPVGEINLSDKVYGIGRGLCSISAKRCNRQYLWYFLKKSKNDLNIYANGSTFTAITIQVLQSFKLTLPPLPEQQAIASFLDAQTKPIDDIIAKRERQIELFEEMKSAIISRAVTKGLNPDAKMKDSGIGWIGKVPDHWDVKCIKYIKANMPNAFVDGPFGSNLKSQHYVEDGDVYVIESGFITSGKFEYVRDMKTITEEHFETIKRSECKENDIIIAKIGAYYGMAAVLPKLDKKSVVSGNSLKITLDNNIMLNDIFVHLMACSKKQNGYIGVVNETAQPALSLYNLNHFKLPVAPLEEQQAIASYLDIETSKIDTRIAKRRKQIELLQEYKQALITAAVTGKIDVREYIS